MTIPDNLNLDFDELFKSTIVPFFKTEGFKRKAQHFIRKTNDIIQCFNVQKSKWNSAESVTFTFNFGFYSDDIRMASLTGETPIDFPKITDCFIQCRLGSYSHKRDHWYELSKKTKKTLEEQVLGDLEKYMKPLFEDYQSLSDLKQYLEGNTRYLISPYNRIIFLMVTGQVEKGVRLLKEHYEEALTPQTITNTINYPDGTKVENTRTYINQDYIDSMKGLADKYQVEL